MFSSRRIRVSGDREAFKSHLGALIWSLRYRVLMAHFKDLLALKWMWVGYITMWVVTGSEKEEEAALTCEGPQHRIVALMFLVTHGEQKRGNGGIRHKRRESRWDFWSIYLIRCHIHPLIVLWRQLSDWSIWFVQFNAVKLSLIYIVS